MSLRLVVFLTALTVAAGDAAAQADTSRVHLRVPDSIGAFRGRERRDFPDKADGVMLRYRRADGLQADLFVYPGPDLASNCDLACARGVLKREADDFVNSFAEFVRLHYVDTISVASDSLLEPPNGSSWRLGRHLHVTQRQQGTAQWSDLYLYYLPRIRVKVRATYAPDSSQARAIADFAAAAAPALTGGGTSLTSSAPTGGSSDTRGIGMSVTLAGPPHSYFPLLLDFLVTHGYTIDDSSRDAGRLVTAPRYAWPTGSEKESWHGAESPGVRVAVRLVPRADSTTIEITAQSPTRAGWTDAKVAQRLQMIASLEIAGALTKSDKDGAKRKP